MRCRRVARGAGNEPATHLAGRRLVAGSRRAVESLAAAPSEFFARLVASFGVRRFERHIWSRLAAHFPSPFAGTSWALPTLESFIASLGGAVRDPASFLIVDGKSGALPIEPALSAPGRIDLRRLAIYLRRERAALRVAQVEQLDPRVSLINRELAAALRAQVWTNAYFTPHAAPMLPRHFDDHDVIVYQAWGSRRWRIAGAATVDLPLAGHEWGRLAHHAPKAGKMTELRLAPGDFAYVPRGFAHEARSTGEGSLHFTFGIRRPTYHALVDGLLRRALEETRGDPELRRAVPLGDSLTVGRSAQRALRRMISGIARDAARSDPSPLVVDLLHDDLLGTNGRGARCGAFVDLLGAARIDERGSYPRTAAPFTLRARRGADFVEVEGPSQTLLAPREALDFLRFLDGAREVRLADARRHRLDDDLARELLRELIAVEVLALPIDR